ncbi:MAG: D-lyxose/D-mannose family sugar isomerase [Acidobacteriaceae bacterium]
MKRSQLNRYIAEADAFFAKNHFVLPPFAQLTPKEWERQGPEANEIRTQRLGWDVTDFASGDFHKTGLTIFTLRNGLSADGKPSKVYAEKIMFVRNRQITPFHYHAKKMEDIINRGGKGAGSLVVRLHNSTEDGRLAQTPVFVSCDGVRRRVEAGGTVTLGPGESVTLPPFLYHMFYALDGDALIGEVSSLNNDDTDNFFLEKLPRYPAVVEDEAPTRLLCTEYHLAPSGA